MITSQTSKATLFFATTVIGSTLWGQNQTPVNAPSPVNQYLGIWHSDRTLTEKDCGRAALFLIVNGVKYEYKCKNLEKHIRLEVKQGTSGFEAAYSFSEQNDYYREPSELEKTRSKGKQQPAMPLFKTDSHTLTLDVPVLPGKASSPGTIRSAVCVNNGTTGTLRNPIETAATHENFTVTLEENGLKVDFEVACGTDDEYEMFSQTDHLTK